MSRVQQEKNMETTKKKTATPYTISSVDRALDLLLLLESSPRAMGVTEIGRALNVQKSTAHNLLQTMLAKGFVQQNEEGRYNLGLRLLRLAAACSERLDVKNIAHPYLEELALETREVALLAVLERDEIMIIDKVESPRSFFMVPRFDFSNTFYCSSIGKVLLAGANDAFLKRILDKGMDAHTSHTITDHDRLLAELDKVRHQGYAVSCDEMIEGVTCISAPILSASGQVTAAIAVSSATSWLPTEAYERISYVLKQKAAQISIKLGYEFPDEQV